MTSTRCAFDLFPALRSSTIASWIAGVGLWATALALLSTPVSQRGYAAQFAATDVVGHAVWKSAMRARRLGEAVALVQDADDDALFDDRPGHAVVIAWLLGFGLWATVLFLIGME